MFGRMPSRASTAAVKYGGLALPPISSTSARISLKLALPGQGLSNAEIARRLYLVEGTVKSYVSAILTRLAAKNCVQAAILAYEAGLVDRDR